MADVRKLDKVPEGVKPGGMMRVFIIFHDDHDAGTREVVDIVVEPEKLGDALIKHGPGHVAITDVVPYGTMPTLG